MNQDRLNNLMILNIHKHVTDSFDQVANDFAFASEYTLTLFGRFHVMMCNYFVSFFI